MQQYIINILNNAILQGKKQKNSNIYDIAFLQEILNKIKNDRRYFYDFILDLNSDLIKELTIIIEPESKREAFLASVIYLKNLTEINKKEDVKIPLSNSQEEILYELVELIKRIIANNNKEENESQKYFKKYGIKYENLLDKFKNNRELSIDDYELIEKLILEYEKESVDKVLNDVVDYLNNYNYRLLPNHPKNVEDDDELEIEVSEENEEVIIKGYNGVFEEPTYENNTSNDNPSENNEENTAIEKLTIEEDNNINTPTEELKEDAKVKNNKAVKKEEKTIKAQTTTDLSLIGLSNITLNEYCTNLVNSGMNIDTINYYNEYLKDLFYQDNYNGIISIVCLSDYETINDLFTYFKEINLNESTIKDLLNRATQIFFNKNKNLFKQNVELALKYHASIEKLIKTNITYFYNSPEYNQNKINMLEEKGLNINKVFEIKPQILAIGLDKLLKNIDLLRSYGFVINEDDYDSLSIINSPNLNIMIDTFIESGFSINLVNESLKSIRSLIIKRIFYAFKNNLNVWNENITKDRINDNYEEWINKERITLSEDEINYLISDYPLLEYLENAKKPMYFNDMSTAQIKRKYEFKFGTNVISRLKVYSIFKVLINHNISDREALFYAIIYNSNLDINDFNSIKKEILGK